jgi:hypothetical protein
MADSRKLPTRSKEPPPKAKPTANLGTKKKPDTGKDKGKSKGKEPKDPYKAAEARADKKQKARDKKAGQKYLEQAENLSAQAKAIRQALDIDLASARDNNLGDISRSLNESLTALRSDADRRAKTFLTAAADSEKATGDTAERGISNAVRERQDTLTNILEQGAGETDAMKAMLMSAKNWQANAAENNRAYFDTINTVNAGINDMNIDTKQAMAGQWSGAEAARDEVWQTFYNNRGQAFTQLGNVLGQQADFYASAKEMGVKPKKGAEKAAEDAMKKAFKDSAVESGKGYTQQATPEEITGYTGQELIRAEQSNSKLEAAMTFDQVAKAEGATLRKWAS